MTLKAVGLAVLATIGGILASNAAGPRRHLYGTARDLLIGVGLVLADGSFVKGGGKVVKNVAGYDVSRLLAGSLGTLGLLLEVTMKVVTKPAATASVRIDRPSGASNR